MSACLCSHPSAHHGSRGDRHCSRILHPGCYCDEFRPRAPVADEAEEWLAARTPAAGEDTHWLTEEFKRAEREWAELPAWARPVVVRPPDDEAAAEKAE